MQPVLPASTHLRKNNNRWPPLHTPLLWQRQIPNRARPWTMYQMTGGFVEPSPRVLSLVTGEDFLQRGYNSREHLNRCSSTSRNTLGRNLRHATRGIETVIHLGPEPNLIPSTL